MFGSDAEKRGEYRTMTTLDLGIFSEHKPFLTSQAKIDEPYTNQMIEDAAMDDAQSLGKKWEELGEDVKAIFRAIVASGIATVVPMWLVAEDTSGIENVQ